MLKIFRSGAQSPINIVWTMVVVGFLAFHTLLFTHVSERLDKALKRVDKLELLLFNIIASDDLHTKEMALAELRRIRSGLDRELGQTAARKVLRTRRSPERPEPVTDVKSDKERLARLEKKVKRCLHKIRKRKPRRIPRNDRVNIGDRSRRSCKSVYNCTIKPTALFTVWGEVKCIRSSKLLLKGQVVLVDGSDFMCLPDEHPEQTFRKNRTRNLGSHVSIRGVTYGDIEDVMSFRVHAPSGKLTRNNKSVPCVICSRENKINSAMLLAPKKGKLIGLNFRRAEYFGVLMSAKQSKQTICVANGAKEYLPTSNGNDKRILKDTVQLHPAELNCDSLHCNANKYYQNGYRIGCAVVTF